MSTGGGASESALVIRVHLCSSTLHPAPRQPSCYLLFDSQPSQPSFIYFMRVIISLIKLFMRTPSTGRKYTLAPSVCVKHIATVVIASSPHLVADCRAVPLLCLPLLPSPILLQLGVGAPELCAWTGERAGRRVRVCV